MSTRNISQIDGPDAELQLIVVPFEKVRQRAAGLVARTDPVLFRMYGLVEELMNCRKYRDAAKVIVAFYGSGASSAVRRMRLISQDQQSLRHVQCLIDEIRQHG
jgi:hypothetical protein